MATASIIITQPANPIPVGVAGRARDDLQLGDSVTLSNADDTNVVAWRWTLEDIPEGSVATLSTPNNPQASFVPDVAGTYLVQLSVNGAGPGETQVRVAAVRDGVYRYPGTPETGPMANYLVLGSPNEKGWGKEVERLLRNALAANTLQGVLVVGNTTGGMPIILSIGDLIQGAAGGTFGFNAGVAEFSGDVNIPGKLTVAGLIDPSGLVLDEQVSVPFTPPVAGKGTLWAMDVAGVTTLMFTTDTGVTTTLATMAGTTLEAVLDAGQTTSGKNIIVSIGDAVAGAGGGTVSFSGGVIQLTDASGTVLYLAGAVSGNAPAGADELVIGNGSAAFGATIFTSNATVGSLLFTDTAGAYQGALRYDHVTNRLNFDASAVARAFISSAGLDPNAAATYDIGSVNRWRDAWLSRALYVAGGVTGHDTNADDLIIGDGSAAPAGATFSSTFGSAIYFADTLAGSQGGLLYAHGTDILTIRAANAEQLKIGATATYPASDNAKDLGLVSTRWRTVYVGMSVITPFIGGADFGAGSGNGGTLFAYGGAGGETSGDGGDSVFSGGFAQGDGIGGRGILASGDSYGAGNVGANVELTVGYSDETLGVVRITNTALEIPEASATPGTPITGGNGRFWVFDSSPSRGMFTNDDGDEIDFTGMPSITMGVGGARLSTTLPATYGETGGTMPTINFADATTQSAHWWIQIPRSYVGGNLIARLWWTGTTASAVTDVRWGLKFDLAVAGRNLAIDNSTATVFTAAGPSAIDLLKNTDVTLTNADMNSITPGCMVRVNLTRLGTNVADTYTGTAEVIGLQLILG